MKKLLLILLCVLLASCSMEPTIPSQYVYFVSPADGAVVSSPFTVKFGVVGMDVAAAGSSVPNSGHHHLLINVDAIPSGQVVPADAQHLHFGKGQTEAEISLAPGTYKLTMQFANGQHVSFGPQMAQTITVTVK